MGLEDREYMRERLRQEVHSPRLGNSYWLDAKLASNMASSSPSQRTAASTIETVTVSAADVSRRTRGNMDFPG